MAPVDAARQLMLGVDQLIDTSFARHQTLSLAISSPVDPSISMMWPQTRSLDELQGLKIDVEHHACGGLSTDRPRRRKRAAASWKFVSHS